MGCTSYDVLPPPPPEYTVTAASSSRCGHSWPKSNGCDTWPVEVSPLCFAACFLGLFGDNCLLGLTHCVAIPVLCNFDLRNSDLNLRTASFAWHVYTSTRMCNTEPPLPCCTKLDCKCDCIDFTATGRNRSHRAGNLNSLSVSHAGQRHQLQLRLNQTEHTAVFVFYANLSANLVPDHFLTVVMWSMWSMWSIPCAHLCYLGHQLRPCPWQIHFDCPWDSIAASLS